MPTEWGPATATEVLTIYRYRTLTCSSKSSRTVEWTLFAQTLPRFETWVSTTLTLNLVQFLAKKDRFFVYHCAAHYCLSWQVFKMPASVRCTIRNFCNSSKALHWEHLCGELCVTAWLATLQLLRICDFYLRFVTKLIIILDFSTFESIE